MDISDIDAATEKRHRPEKNEQLDSPHFFFGDVTRATGVSTNLLKAWLSREPRVVRLGPHDIESERRGQSRLFTLRRIISIAITAELVSLGLSPSKAGQIGFFATDFDPVPSFDLTNRSLLEPDESDLHIYSDGQFYSPSVDDEAAIKALLRQTIRNPEDKPAASCIVFSVGSIAMRVTENLGR
jgi:hypothetical protein